MVSSAAAVRLKIISVNFRLISGLVQRNSRTICLFCKQGSSKVNNLTHVVLGDYQGNCKTL